MFGIKSWVISGCLLSVLATGSFFVFSRAPKPPSRSVVKDTAAPRPPPTPVLPVAVDWARHSNTDERLTAMEKQLAERREPTAPAAVLPEEAPSAREIEQDHASRLAAQASEPLSAAWATRTATALKEDFTRELGDAKHTVKSVDCRSSSCTVTLAWPSREDALEGWKRAIHTSVRPAGGRGMRGPA